MTQKSPKYWGGTKILASCARGEDSDTILPLHYRFSTSKKAVDSTAIV
ncbi:MAG: hypothetical protein RL757_1214 [Bacteroidota bacterium]|jgi:hypothetical protein